MNTRVCIISTAVWAVVSALAFPAMAQPATIAVFPATASDPNTAVPIAAPVQYTPTCGVTPKLVEITPIVNPNTGAYDDPADASKDCTLNIAAQFSALPQGQTYKAAVKLGVDPFGPFSTAFSVSAAQVTDLCALPDPTSGTVVAGTRTITWCYPENATGGSPITGWALYVDGARSLPSVVVGTVQPSGRRAYTASIAVATGSRQIQVAPINAIGEGTKSAVFTLSVQAPTTAPTGTPAIRGVN